MMVHLGSQARVFGERIIQRKKPRQLRESLLGGYDEDGDNQRHPAAKSYNLARVASLFLRRFPKMKSCG